MQPSTPRTGENRDMTEAAPGPDRANPDRADPDRANPDRAVFRLIYRSRDLIPLDNRKTELGVLFSEARSNNKKQDITGALLVHGDWFAQVLEGSKAPIRTLFARIEQDGRHDNVSVIASGPAERLRPLVHGPGLRGRGTRHPDDRAPGRDRPGRQPGYDRSPGGGPGRAAPGHQG
jgi:FAD-dependent sensor of blue light